ncbi:RNA-binding protein 25-like [Trifolium medium]|uniref:RNA-binding protein 25-like n=1 Tax=Trifolium medium TaxID=97028 RepID=A0A392LZR2_9FABA|nr:RNA-binding protein 25-like [Trifolium medium]
MREKPRERGGGRGRGDDETTTLYFTNFPDYLTVKDLWVRFAAIWRVEDVYIPLKLDRKGKRFGFVRFWDVQNVEQILEKLEDIWFDYYKLRANIAKHLRGEDQSNKGKLVQINGSTGKGDGGMLKQGTSFKQTLVGGVPLPQQNNTVGRKKSYQKQRLTESQILERTMEVDVVEENIKKF